MAVLRSPRVDGSPEGWSIWPSPRAAYDASGVAVGFFVTLVLAVSRLYEH